MAHAVMILAAMSCAPGESPRAEVEGVALTLTTADLAPGTAAGKASARFTLEADLTSGGGNKLVATSRSFALVNAAGAKHWILVVPAVADGVFGPKSPPGRSRFQSIGTIPADFANGELSLEGELLVATIERDRYSFETPGVNATAKSRESDARVLLFDEEDGELSIEIRLRRAARASEPKNVSSNPFSNGIAQETRLEVTDAAGEKLVFDRLSRSARRRGDMVIDSLRGARPSKGLKPASMNLVVPRITDQPRRAPFKFEKVVLSPAEKRAT